jgi:DNA-binding response OmpR family regulator
MILQPILQEPRRLAETGVVPRSSLHRWKLHRNGPFHSSQSAHSKEENPANPVVLLVDDDPLVRPLLSRFLADANFTVLTAATGQEAISVFDQEKSRLQAIILDIILPDMTGDLVLDHIRRHSGSLPVLMISGFGNTTKVPEHPSTRFLQKPFNPHSLVQTIGEMLQRD